MERAVWTEGATRQVIDGLPAGAEVWFYQASGGRPAGLAFHGKANRPDWHYVFQSEARRTAYVETWVRGIIENQATKELEAAAKRNAPNPFKAGDILEGSWGYDQTNVEFYQVVSTAGKAVYIQEMSHKTVPGSEGFMCDSVLPDLPLRGSASRHIVQYDGRGAYVKLHKHCWLSLWNGRSQGRSWYA